MTDRMPSGEALDPGRRALAPVRPDVDVDEPRPVQLGHAQLVGQDVHGPPVRLGVRAGEVDEVGGMDRERGDAVAGEPLPERRQLARGRGRRRHEVGLSLKTWSADAPISAARSAALTMPCPSGRCAPSRRPFGSIGRRVAERVVPERSARCRRVVPERAGAAVRQAGRPLGPRLAGMDADLLTGLRALVDQHRLRIVGPAGRRPGRSRDPRRRAAAALAPGSQAARGPRARRPRGASCRTGPARSACAWTASGSWAVPWP